MGKQFELFEAEERHWIDRLWQSMPPKARGEVIGISIIFLTYVGSPVL